MKKIINNNEIFLSCLAKEKFPVMLFVHNHIRLFFALGFYFKAKNPIINFLDLLNKYYRCEL